MLFANFTPDGAHEEIADINQEINILVIYGKYNGLIQLLTIWIRKARETLWLLLFSEQTTYFL